MSNKITFSFSNLKLYESCKYAWYKKYIEGSGGCGNFYASNGKIMHDIFAKLLKREIDLKDAPIEYQEEYKNICETTRQSTMDSTYEKCIDYLCEVPEFDFNKYEVILAEEKMEFKIGKYNFVGYADCLLKDKTNGNMILVDHKSASHIYKKDGTVLKSQQNSYESYKKQLHLYCKGIFDCYGIKVDKMCIHHFKDGGCVSIIPLIQQEYEDTLKWAIETIEEIRKDETFEANPSYLMCKELCNARMECEYIEE